MQEQENGPTGNSEQQESGKRNLPKLKLDFDPKRVSGVVEVQNKEGKMFKNGEWVNSGKPTTVALAYNYVDLILCFKMPMKRLVFVNNQKKWEIATDSRGKPTPLWRFVIWPSGEEVVFYDSTAVYDGKQLPHLYYKMRDAIKQAIAGENGELLWDQNIRNHIFRLERVRGNSGRITYDFKYKGRVPVKSENAFGTDFTERARAPESPGNSLFNAQSGTAKAAPLALSENENKLIAAFNEVVKKRLGEGANLKQILGEKPQETVVLSLTNGLTIDGAEIKISLERATTISQSPQQYGLIS